MVNNQQIHIASVRWKKHITEDINIVIKEGMCKT